jgi:hypothetical protein
MVVVDYSDHTRVLCVCVSVYATLAMYLDDVFGTCFMTSNELADQKIACT